MLKDAWGQRSSQSGARKRALEAERDAMDKSIEELLVTVTQVRSPVVMASFEKRIEEFENQKLAMAERIENFDQSRMSFEDTVRTAHTFLKTP